MLYSGNTPLMNGIALGVPTPVTGSQPLVTGSVESVPKEDSQVFNACMTPGPIKLVNNHLEGAGENAYSAVPAGALAGGFRLTSRFARTTSSERCRGCLLASTDRWLRRMRFSQKVRSACCSTATLLRMCRRLINLVQRSIHCPHFVERRSCGG